ncbi:hypothetical protein HYDPIDRAFT_38559 [Hydnomerulius pinastri MD-312]|nr:hypothetical protein HYDPIDRAFT_38559 [Hydnomerulius pinastri MD-312]
MENNVNISELATLPSHIVVLLVSAPAIMYGPTEQSFPHGGIFHPVQGAASVETPFTEGIQPMNTGILPGPAGSSQAVPNAHTTTPSFTVLGPPSQHVCHLAGDAACTDLLFGTVPSIRTHLRMHGHKHREKSVVPCPWEGCNKELRWMNIPRHIRSVHLGVRVRCVQCGKPFSREKALEAHLASQKCEGNHGAGQM